MMKLDYTLYLDVAGRFMQIAVYAMFVVGCFRLWRITCRISLGFELIGRTVTIVQFLALILMAFGPERVTLFRVIVYTSLSVWLFYTTWYFTTYPIPPEYLKASRVPSLPEKLVYVPKQALLRYLIDESPALKQPWWHSHTFRNIGIGGLGILLLLYGFNQTINGYTFGYRLAANEREKAAIETKKAVVTAVKAATDSTQQAIMLATQPLYAGQRWLARKLDTNDKASVGRAAEVKRALTRASRTKQSPPLIIVAPAPRQLPQASFELPTIKQPATTTPTRIRGRKVGLVDQGNDLDEVAQYRDN